jgi:4-alpha-glucanotransferase
MCIRFTAYATGIGQEFALGVCGNQPLLGNWQPEHALLLNDNRYPEWDAIADASAFTFPLEFKFILFDKQTRQVVAWEEHDNRLFPPAPFSQSDAPVTSYGEVSFNLPRPRIAGVSIPVFSLRSEESFGIGDFGDLKMLIEWAAQTGQRLVQLLPVNDTTRTHTRDDSYPYNAISIYALHPLYIDLRQLPKLNDEYLRKKFRQLRKTLNALPTVDYEAVDRAKWSYLRYLYQQEQATMRADVEFHRFIDDNRAWLMPYADYCRRRDAGTQGIDTTDENLYLYIQYHLHRQLLAASTFARSQGVLLKGDIPIGVSRDSVEVETEPQYFNLDGQAGAPPDAFATEGQNWGFPTYRWEVMAADGYVWWKKRLKHLAQYFDAYRIDHILGFFRIWEIPVGETDGLLGQFQPALPLTRKEIEEFGVPFTPTLFLKDHRNPKRFQPRIAAKAEKAYQELPDEQRAAFDRFYQHFFYERHNEFWKQLAMQKLPPLLSCTRMLACGEDLGMIPACVPQVMNDLQILSLELERMPKAPEETFGTPASYPYLSVCTVSTHDMPTLRSWFADDPSPEACRDIIIRNLHAPSIFCIIAWQDWLSMSGELRLPDAAAERINEPSDPHHYWRYRMHLTLEALLGADSLNESIRSLIKESGRERR